MKTKYKIIIIISTITILMFLALPSLFRAILHPIPDDAKIQNVYNLGYLYVTDGSGTCYVTTRPSTGSDGSLKIRHRSLYTFCNQSGIVKEPVKYFENIASVSVDTVVTKDHDLYIKTGSKNFPQYVFGGVLQAEMINGTVYYVNTDHDLFAYSPETGKTASLGLGNVRLIHHFSLWNGELIAVIHTNGDMLVYEPEALLHRQKETMRFADIKDADMVFTGDDATLLVLLKTDGSVWWQGRLYEDKHVNSKKSREIAPEKIADHAIQVECYNNGVLYIDDQQRLHAIGYDYDMESSPVDKVVLENARAVSSNSENTCAVDSDGHVWLWGYHAWESMRYPFSGAPYKIH